MDWNDDKPKRIQRKRTKGWRMPEGAVSCTRPGKYGNPFVIGGYFRMGDGRPGFSYLQCLSKELAGPGYTLIETAAQAVEWFREYRKRYPFHPDDLAALRGKDLACFCALDQPCHVDVLLEVANV